MKKFTVINYRQDKLVKIEIEADDISDEYHTFDELYEHRLALNVALCHMIEAVREVTLGPPYLETFKSLKHNDGTMFDGYFIVMIVITLDTGNKEQISYHYKIEHWDDFKIPSKLICPDKYDGHTSVDVISRLLKRF